MKTNYKDIHESLITKSLKYTEIKNQIFKNGIISLPKPKIDFFSFVVKTIISQQISDKAANSIWEKFCQYFEKNIPNLKKIDNVYFLKTILNNIGISKKKKEYIVNFYRSVSSNSINLNLLKKQEENEFKKQFIKFKGVGDWTCDMILIFFFLNLTFFLQTI